ncbi:ABC transporter permease [Demequina aurantiaca]|uniref:ABC transporter permease n=1 Tax=Demequina aurantiaca TaxID=676200 RepID=UPI003D350F83
MFVALRDLKFARGRFALICSVITLVTILVGFLSGLAGGLASQNVSGVLALPFDKLVIATSGTGDTADFSSSNVTADQLDAWAAAAGVTSAVPLGITQARAESTWGDAAVTIFGYDGIPEGDSGELASVASGNIVLSSGAAGDLGAAVGDSVSVAGTEFVVSAIGGDWWYSHTAVVQTSLSDWQGLAGAQRQSSLYATAIAVTGAPAWDDVAATTDTTASGRLASLTAIPAFASEVGSLGMMIGMLFGISALVIGAFFTVWTIQRAGDIAVLKALGASSRTLTLDALGQAAIVLAVGIGIGITVVIALGSLSPSALPFLISPITTALPAALMVVLGLGGAAVGVRTVTSVDPLSALGSAR